MQVTSDAETTFLEDQRSLMLLVLCPGFFQCSALVEEAAQALKAVHRLRYARPNSLAAQRSRTHCIASRKNLVDAEGPGVHEGEHVQSLRSPAR